MSELLGDATVFSERVHLVQGSRRVTFAAMFEAVERVSGHLWRAGLRPGDRLMVLAPNSPEWVITLWGAIRLGALPALANGWWSATEIGHAVNLVGPRFVITDARLGKRLPDDLPTASVIDVATVRSWVDATAAGPAVAPLATADEDDPAVLIFTAGTTGFPKAVTLAHRSVIANLHGLLAVSGRLPHQVDHTKPAAVVLQSGPLFHIGGLQSLLLALLGGSRIVFLEGRFDPGEVLDLIDREGVTVWGAIPTMASRVLEHPSIRDRDLTSVRSISMGGAPVLPELSTRLREVFTGAQRGMSTIYGMTETGGTVAAASGRLMAEHPLTSGAPMPLVDLKIDHRGPDGIGEIVVRTAGQMVGYWGEREGGLIDAEGWLRTGDLGRTEDGLLWVTGRSKDIIIRGGENIAAAHVEAVLLSHPGVAVVAVVGLPDPDLGEQVGAVVQVRRGADVHDADLVNFAASRLARFEIPARWWLWTEEIPMSDAGKVEKHRLAQAWAERLRS